MIINFISVKACVLYDMRSIFSLFHIQVIRVGDRNTSRVMRPQAVPVDSAIDRYLGCG